MADIREVFTILETSTGAGQSYEGKAPGNAQATDVQAPVLPAVDLAGNLQNIPLRDEGDASATAEAVPGLVFKDSSGNLVYPQLTAAGKISVDLGTSGTLLQDLGNTNIGNVGVAQSVAAIALVNSKSYEVAVGSAGATKAVKWELIFTNNGTPTLLETKISGPGDYNVNFQLGISFTTGATGAQTLEIKGTQLKGPNTDLYASAQVIQLP